MKENIEEERVNWLKSTLNFYYNYQKTKCNCNSHINETTMCVEILG